MTDRYLIEALDEIKKAINRLERIPDRGFYSYHRTVLDRGNDQWIEVVKDGWVCAETIEEAFATVAATNPLDRKILPLAEIEERFGPTELQ